MNKIEKLLEFDPQAPSKSWAQLLQENPQQKGGLAQLASAESQALSRSSPEPQAKKPFNLKEWHEQAAQEACDNLNRKVMMESETVREPSI